eukprot:g321.t1
MMAPYGNGQITSFVVPEGSQAGDTLELTVPAPPPVVPLNMAMTPAMIHQYMRGAVAAGGMNAPPNIDPAGWAQLARHLSQLGPLWAQQHYAGDGAPPPMYWPGATDGPSGASHPNAHALYLQQQQQQQQYQQQLLQQQEHARREQQRRRQQQRARQRARSRAGGHEYVIRSLLNSMVRNVQQKIKKEERQAIMAKERHIRSVKQALVSATRRELAYRRKLFRSHTEIRPKGHEWPPRDKTTGSIISLPKIDAPPALLAESSTLLFLKWTKIDEAEEAKQMWDRKFWVTLAKSKVPKQPKLHGVLWCEALLYQAKTLGISTEHSLCRELLKQYIVAKENLSKGKKKVRHYRIRAILGEKTCLPPNSSAAALTGPPGTLLGLSTFKKRSFERNRRRGGGAAANNGDKEPGDSRAKSSRGKGPGRYHQGLWMEDWDNWIVHETETEYETLMSISKLSGIPSIETLLSRNRRRYPSIRPGDMLAKGTIVLVRPNVEKVRGAAPAPRWRGVPWLPQPGDVIDARWDGGRDAQYPGYFPATVRRVFTSSKRKKMLEIRYYDGSIDTAVPLSDIRFRSTRFGASWPHRQKKASTSFGLSYSNLERSLERKYRFDDTPRPFDAIKIFKEEECLPRSTLITVPALPDVSLELTRSPTPFITVSLPKVVDPAPTKARSKKRKKKTESSPSSAPPPTKADGFSEKKIETTTSTKIYEGWVPDLMTVVEARWKGGVAVDTASWYAAIVLSAWPSPDGREPTLALRYEDGSIDPAVSLRHVRKLLDASVLGRRIRVDIVGYGPRYGLVSDADLLRGMFVVRYDDGDEEDVDGDELRRIICDRANPRLVRELMSCSKLTFARVAKECKIHNPHQFADWLDRDSEDASVVMPRVCKAIDKWYRRAASASMRNHRRAARKFGAETFRKCSFGVTWRDYDEVDYEELAPTYEGLARALEHIPFRAKMKKRKMSGNMEMARNTIAKGVLKAMKKRGISRPQLANMCRLRGLKALHYWLQGEKLHLRSVRDAGHAAMLWLDAPSTDFGSMMDRWEHRHRACPVCGNMINSAHRGTNWRLPTCVDCAIVHTNHRADVARVRSLVDTLRIKSNHLARETGGSARPLNLWLSNVELGTPRVRKAGDIATLWYVKSIVTAETCVLEKSNHRAEAARVNFVLSHMGMSDSASRAIECGVDVDDHRLFDKFLKGRDVGDEKKARAFFETCRRWFDGVIYPPKRRWTVAKGELFGITPEIVAKLMQKKGISVKDLASKLGLATAIGLEWWLANRELHYNVVEAAKQAVLKWYLQEAPPLKLDPPVDLAVVESPSKSPAPSEKTSIESLTETGEETTCSTEIEPETAVAAAATSPNRTKSKKGLDRAEGDWVAYLTSVEDETLRSVSKLTGTPSLDTLVRRNSLRYPGIKPDSLLKAGTLVLIKPQTAQSVKKRKSTATDAKGSNDSRRTTKKRKASPWKPSVGDQVEARWAGGEEGDYSGWYVAHVVRVRPKRRDGTPQMAVLRYFDGSLDDSVPLSDIRKRSVGMVPVEIAKAPASSESTRRKDPRIGPQYQLTELPSASSSSPSSSSASAATKSADAVEKSETYLWPYEVATCEASYEGDWNGEWESCRVLGVSGDSCRIVCKEDLQEIDNVPQRWVRRKDVTVTLYGELQAADEWCFEVATCDNDFDGAWTGPWEPCRLISSSGGFCKIVCKCDGKKIDKVPQRFVRLSTSSKKFLNSNRPEIVVQAQDSYPLLHSTVKSLVNREMWFLREERSNSSKWTHEEKEKFNSAIMQYGPVFRCLSKEIGTKTVHDVISYYYREFKFKSNSYTEYRETQEELEGGALPPGWKVVVRHRGALGGAKGTYKIYVSPDDKKFRSLAAVNRYFIGHNLPGCDLAKLKKAFGEGPGVSRRPWIPAIGEVIEARGPDGEYCLAHVTGYLPREENGGQQMLTLRYGDGTVGASVSLIDARKRIDEDVVGRRIRRVREDASLAGVVVDADVQRDLFLIRFDDDSEDEVTSRKLRMMLSNAAGRRKMKSVECAPSSSSVFCEKRRERYMVEGKEIAPDNLPSGWKTVEVVRRSGKTAGTRDRYFISPEGRRFRSLKELERFVSGDLVDIPSPRKMPRSVSMSSDGSDDSIVSGAVMRSLPRRKIKPLEMKEGSEANLPDGWKAVVRQRGALGGAKGTYTYYVSPGGKKFRSLAAVRRFLSTNGEVGDKHREAEEQEGGGGEDMSSFSHHGLSPSGSKKRNGSFSTTTSPVKKARSTHSRSPFACGATEEISSVSASSSTISMSASSKSILPDVNSDDLERAATIVDKLSTTTTTEEAPLDPHTDDNGRH